MTDVFTSSPSVSSTINNIGGDTTIALSSALIQAINESANAGIYGGGEGGSLTLVANTVLTLNNNVLRLVNLDLAGFELSHHLSDLGIVAYVNTLLTMGSGGTIVSRLANVGGEAGDNGTGSGGDGGIGADGAGYTIVFAKEVLGDVGARIGGGWPGAPGTNATASTALSGGSGGNQSTRQTYWYDVIYANTIFTGGKGGAGAGFTFQDSTGGLGGAGLSTIVAANGILQTARDLRRWFYNSGGPFPAPTIIANFDMSHNESAGGGGGGGGGDNASDGDNRSVAGGGGGGGGAWISSGGAGGTSFANFDGIDLIGCTGGGGGGGGGSGCVTIVMCNKLTGALTVSAAGGDGGAGGDGFSTGMAAAPGGAGGGGGGGGVCVYIGPSGATVTAAGGLGGAAGASFFPTAAPQPGFVGVDGVPHASFR